MITKEKAKNIVRGITDKIEATTDIDDWAEFWGFTREEYEEFLDMAIKALEQSRWIPCSERLPKENEYIGNVCKYYLIQDEYGDMHVAHLSNVGWIPMDSLKAIGDEVIAWRELPLPYKENQDVCKDCYYNDGEVHAECVICDKAESEDEEVQDDGI